jgi:hypothetical protein
MGRQFSFYLSLDDQVRMNRIILDTLPDTIVIKDRVSSNRIEILDGALKEKDIGVAASGILLARRKDIDKISIKPPVTTGEPSLQKFNFIDILRSPVVEYILPSVIENGGNNKIIRRGRLYYNPSYFVPGKSEKIEKDKEFLDFAIKLFKLFKNSLVYESKSKFYYGYGALNDEKDGWVLPIN